MLPEYERAMTGMGSALPYRWPRTLLAELLPLDTAPDVETVRRRTLQVGARLERAALVPTNEGSPAPAQAITLAIDAGHVKSVRTYQVRSFKVCGVALGTWTCPMDSSPLFGLLACPSRHQIPSAAAMNAPMQNPSRLFLISPSDGDAEQIAAIVGRGFELHKAGDPSRAQRLYRLVLALDPAHFDGMHLLGVASRPGSPVNALRWITRALRLFPGHGPAQHNLVAALQSAITLTNSLYEERRFRELCLIADTLTVVERFREEPACEMLGRMLHNAAGSALYEDDDADLSLACADRACRLLQHPSALNFRMLARLNHQDYAAGWNRSDWKTIARQTGQWDGEPCRGPLVILSRNGTGDLLQFLRFVPRVTGMASRIIMVLRSEQIQLVRHSPLLAGVTLLSTDPGIPGSAYCDVFSLPFALGLGEADITVPTPYLVPPADLVADWRRAVRRDGRLHVGITWASWAAADRRSVPFTFFDRLMAQTDAAFVGLHSNFSQNDLREAAFPENFRFLGVSDLLTTACALSAMDVVIAPDGGIAHLACALGVESWVLTTRNCDWRWRVEEEESQWYGNARLFRQPVEGDWDLVWERVAKRLTDRSSTGA